MEGFFIRKIDTHGSNRSAWMRPAVLSLTGFIFLLDGEVLVESCGQANILSAGHLLLIPENEPFVVPHFSDAVGFSGRFPSDLLTESRRLQVLKKPFQQAFWFDEGLFIGELFNMLHLSFQREDKVFIDKGLDILISRLRPAGQSSLLPQKVAAFMEQVFDETKAPATIAEYAAEASVSPNYLNRMVKDSTGRPVGDWIEISRLNKAKRLLETTNQPIIDVAASIGIDDQSYFARFFRKKTGLTPSAYRKAMHEKS